MDLLCIQLVLDVNKMCSWSLLYLIWRIRSEFILKGVYLNSIQRSCVWKHAHLFLAPSLNSMWASCLNTTWEHQEQHAGHQVGAWANEYNENKISSNWRWRSTWISANLLWGWNSLRSFGYVWGPLATQLMYSPSALNSPNQQEYLQHLNKCDVQTLDGNFSRCDGSCTSLETLCRQKYNSNYIETIHCGGMISFTFLLFGRPDLTLWILSGMHLWKGH